MAGLTTLAEGMTDDGDADDAELGELVVVIWHWMRQMTPMVTAMMSKTATEEIRMSNRVRTGNAKGELGDERAMLVSW